MKKILSGALVFGILMAVCLPAMSKRTNCGGNSAALHYTRSIAFAAHAYSRDVIGDSKSIHVENFLKNDVYLPQISFGWGMRSYWIKKETEWDNEDPFVICGQLFSNVPRRSWRNFYRGNPGHAAAYLSGEARILSPAEFESIDLDSYLLVEESESSER